VRAALTDSRAGCVAAALAPLAAVGLLALTHAGGAGATVQALADTRITWTLVLLGLAAAGPVLHSGLLRAGQATVGARYGRWEAIRLATAIQAANLAVRLAGVAGLGVLLADDRGGAVGRVPRSAAYVLGREVEHVAFAGLVIVALVLRGLDGHLSPIILGGAAAFLVSRVAHVALLCVAATRPQSLPRWRRLDRLRTHAPAFARVLRQAAGDPRRLVPIAAWALAVDTLRIGWLWVALQAVGAHTTVDRTVEAYGVVALLGTISILPAGLGAVDAGLAVTLHHSGVTLTAAMAGVLLYRVAELWVPLAAGVRPALTAVRGPRRAARGPGARRARGARMDPPRGAPASNLATVESPSPAGCQAASSTGHICARASAA
jgi:uncharacterized membrane protein YbhN (UPF0104 family)